jgi:leader peptidase (prepilin peptidase)/N-methyltransferase
VVEALAAVLCLAIWSVHGWSVTTLLFSLFSLVLLAMSFIDLEFKIIPDPISLGGMSVALLLAILGLPGYPIDGSSAFFGAIVGYAGFWILSRMYFWMSSEEGLGGGDIKLMGFIGAIVGVKGVVTTILVGSVLGSLVGLIFMIAYKKSKRFPIPFGPFLALGALVSVFGIDQWWWSGF